MPEVNQPIDVEDDFAAQLEGLDANEQDGKEQDDIGVQMLTFFLQNLNFLFR